MIQLEHQKRIVDACYPETTEEAAALWHEIKPVKFGNSVNYDLNVSLATYQIPSDAAYMLILRVECYVTTFEVTAPGFWLFAPPPEGSARWVYSDIPVSAPDYFLTPTKPIFLYCDADEFLFAKGDHRVSLDAQLFAPPDATIRFIRTLVYAYLVGALIADRLGASESTYFGTGV